ncbi:MAG: prepilin peptidase [Actinomycetota bacterium]|nr:prepilin peptidase [Actinomycetota bacterium]
MTALFAGFAALLGLIFGSFATMAAHRIPLRAGLNGRSRCPACGHMITAAENIPLFSYLTQRGRCRHCRARISVRYPLIELLTAILFALAALRFGPSLEALIYAGFFWVLIVLSDIDIRLKLLPDVIIFPALASGSILIVLAAALDGELGRMSGVLLMSGVVVLAVLALARGKRHTLEGPEGTAAGRRALSVRLRGHDVWLPGVGWLLGWGVLLILAFISGPQEALSGAVVGAAVFAGFFLAILALLPNGMGGGDVKLGLFLGTFLGYLGGPGLVLVAIYAALLVGSLVGIIYARLTGRGGKTAIPFGPFLALGAIVAVLVGEHVIHLYSGLVPQ